ncbi:MAG: hypothetical protein Kow0075_10180 [Salibacteraceae bacterium]
MAIGYIAYHLMQAHEVSLIDGMNFSGSRWIYLTIPSLLLVILNWGIEIKKWHLLVGPSLEVSLRSSIKGVLSGSTVGILTPNRIGEFVGRVIALRPGVRSKGAVLSLLNGASQSLATITFGFAGLIFLLYIKGEAAIGTPAALSIQLILVAFLVILFFFYIRLPHFLISVCRIGKLQRFADETSILQHVTQKELSNLYQLSLIRFMTFMAQYALVFYLLIDNPVWVLVFGASALTLFSSTIFAFIPIPDLLIRGSFALSYFGLFGFTPLVVAQAVLLVWMVNVALPALAGAVIILSHRIFADN